MAETLSQKYAENKISYEGLFIAELLQKSKKYLTSLEIVKALDKAVKIGNPRKELRELERAGVIVKHVHYLHNSGKTTKSGEKIKGTKTFKYRLAAELN